MGLGRMTLLNEDTQVDEDDEGSMQEWAHHESMLNQEMQSEFSKPEVREEYDEWSRSVTY